MRKPVSILLGLLIISMNGSCVFAQNDNAKTSLERRNDRLKQGFLTTLRRNQTIANSRMEIRVADINRSVQLDDAQLRKLQIAAKGAVQSYIEKEGKVLAERARKLGFDFDIAAELDEPVDQARRSIPTGFYGANSKKIVETIENEKIWLSSVEKILTKEQYETHNNLLQERITQHENLALDLFIARADSTLLLSKEQRKQMRDAIEVRYGDQLSARLTRHFARVNEPRRTMKKEIDTTIVDNILTEAQLAQWKISFGAEIEQMDSVIEQRGNAEE